jgi:hypothetical protein
MKGALLKLIVWVIHKHQKPATVHRAYNKARNWFVYKARNWFVCKARTGLFARRNWFVCKAYWFVTGRTVTRRTGLLQGVLVCL